MVAGFVQREFAIQLPDDCRVPLPEWTADVCAFATGAGREDGVALCPAVPRALQRLRLCLLGRRGAERRGLRCRYIRGASSARGRQEAGQERWGGGSAVCDHWSGACSGNGSSRWH